jgi:hypothetical protein
MKLKLGLLLVLFFNLSCSKKSADDESSSTTASADNTEETIQADCIVPGDIVISNSGSDAVLVLNSDGSYKNIALNVNNIAETVYGVTWDRVNNRLLVAVDGADRIVAVDPVDCSTSTAISDGNLTGTTLKGLTVVDNGDILVTEVNMIERFTQDGMRITTGGWPKTLQTTSNGIYARNNGGFVLCSSGADVVRTYDDAGTQIATKASGIVSTTDAMDCMELANGNIAVTWSGTTDTVKVYSSDLVTEIASYSNISLLSSPGGIAEKSNGNLLVVDRLNHYIVELEADGSYVGILGDGVLNTPEFLIVVPE